MAERTPASASGGGGARYQTSARRAGVEYGTVTVRAPMRATNVPVQYPMLTERDYSLWDVKMKIIIRPFGVWSAVEGDSYVLGY
jgi:starvation-inducible outer membrane lipoprotein